MNARTTLAALALLTACGGAASAPPAPALEAPTSDSAAALASAPVEPDSDPGPEVAALAIAPDSDAGEPLDTAPATSPDAGLAADAGAGPIGPTPEHPVLIDCSSAHDCELCRERVALERPDWLASGAVVCVQR